MTRPTLVFVRVVTKPEYEPGAQRWLASYLQHRPAMPHDLVVINRYKDGDGSFDDVATSILRYDGDGWDCGAWQFAGRNIPAELLVCFNSTTQITGDGWLERFVAAVVTHGEGLYGPMASLENAPHIRTPCVIFTPKVINDYPGIVKDREGTYQFESLGFPGIPNFSLWTQRQGRPVKMVAWSGVYDLADCRKPQNVFRKGNQGDLIVTDKHADEYARSDADQKACLEAMANG